jgi:hypothetical protein
LVKRERREKIRRRKGKEKWCGDFFFERVTYYFLLERGKNNLRFLHKKW